jgi:peptidoglycan/LPS O-acetylase OafA/YrhL
MIGRHVMDQPGQSTAERYYVKVSIGDHLDRNKGVGPGFDFLRLALAISIVSYHGIDVTQGKIATTGLFGLFVESSLPMFFALSGFLVTASAQRLALPHFLVNRGLRIFPALLVEIFFSAVLLGAVCTSLPLAVYYTSKEFISYFLNVSGLIHYFLPGVFQDNPHKGVVNLSLWTVPWELFCYLIISVLILTGLIRRPRVILFGGMAAIIPPAVLYLLMLFANANHSAVASSMLEQNLYYNSPDLSLHDASVGRLAKWLVLTVCGWGFRVIPFFLSGCLLYTFRYRVPYHWGLGTLLLALLLLGSLAMPFEWDGPLLNLALCPALTYLTVLVGLTRMPMLPVYRNGDYSYGIYLYGYPIQQVVVLLGLDRLIWWQNVLISIPLISVFAMFSWHLIERPILLQRKKLSFLTERYDQLSRSG